LNASYEIDEDTGEVAFPEIWNVSQVTSHIKGLLTRDGVLASLTVRGEITNLSRSAAGHIYFGLKDDKSYLKCVSFRSSAQRLTDQPEEGEMANASGRIGLYEVGGLYQLYVEDLVLAGKGELYLAFEKLKRTLEAEGLFEEERKKPLPEFPRFVGVVTSPSGAAVRDFLRVSADRSPHVRVAVSPALVQGETAPKAIIGAIDRLEKLGDIDMIIIARGGGSFEDLNCFNDEKVARRIAACSKPTVNAVGHETDFTIADFVADFRAPTPTGAAQMVLPDRDALLEQVNVLLDDITGSIARNVSMKRQELATYAARLNVFRPIDRIADARQRLDEVIVRIARAASANIFGMRAETKAAIARLAALDPNAVLARGYSIAYGPDGGVLTDSSQVKPGDEMLVKLGKGEVKTQVKESK